MEITNLKMQMIHIDNIPKKVLSIMNDGYLYYHEDESNYPIYDGGCFSNIIFNGFGLSEELLNKVIRLNQLTNCDYLMVKTDLIMAHELNKKGFTYGCSYGGCCYYKLSKHGFGTFICFFNQVSIEINHNAEANLHKHEKAYKITKKEYDAKFKEALDLIINYKPITK